MNVTIREADLTSAADGDAIVEILNSYASDPIGGGQSLSDDVRARIPPGLRDHPTATVFLAFVDEHAVGVAVCFWGFSTFQGRPLLNVHDLAVVPDYRGRGIGRALLKAVEAAAMQRGCCKITLEVQDANVGARRLYERFGFTDFVIANSATRFLSKPLRPYVH
jgi:ribosomal protein S18 acetylase RimI-like enzyme